MLSRWLQQMYHVHLKKKLLTLNAYGFETGDSFYYLQKKSYQEKTGYRHNGDTFLQFEIEGVRLVLGENSPADSLSRLCHNEMPDTILIFKVDNTQVEEWMLVATVAKHDAAFKPDLRTAAVFNGGNQDSWYCEK